MMQKKLLIASALTIFTFFVLLFTPDREVNALVRPNISSLLQKTPTYPIPELGNCQNGRECNAYCETPENKPACWSYLNFRLGQVLGQSTDNRATSDAEIEIRLNSRGVVFPVSELGNCTVVSSCRSYCNNDNNYEACESFALKYDLTGQPRAHSEKQMPTLLSLAKNDLGCTNRDSCKTLCDKNPTRCREFLKKVQLSKDRIRRDLLLGKARSVLGCSTFSSCQEVCEQDKKRCTAFVQKFGLRKSINSKAQTENSNASPGCQTDSECRQFCQNSPSKCPGFRQTKIEPITTPTPERKNPSGQSGQPQP